MNLAEFLQQGESEILEFKTAFKEDVLSLKNPESRQSRQKAVRKPPNSLSSDLPNSEGT